MKAIVYRQYGSPDVLKLEETEKPTPKDDEVLVKVFAVSLNRSDWEGLTGKPLYGRIGGLLKPRHPILGSDIAGWVEVAGGNVKEFQPGDEVFGEIPGYRNGFAEYACVPEKNLVRKPKRMTFEQAAAIPQAGVIALRGIRDVGRVQRGQHVLINGAGGGAGTFAVQLAKLCGAEVTGVDNGAKLEFLRSLGADHVVDYATEDFTKSGKQYDLILDVVAFRSVFECRRALKPSGTYFVVGGSVATLLQVLLVGPWIKRTTGKSVRVLLVPQTRENLISITELCEAGKIVPIIDRLYPLSEVPQALRFLGEGRALGKVVITMGDRA